jgi:hypothetical protein
LKITINELSNDSQLEGSDGTSSVGRRKPIAEVRVIHQEKRTSQQTSQSSSSSWLGSLFSVFYVSGNINSSINGEINERRRSNPLLAVSEGNSPIRDPSKGPTTILKV